MARSLALLVTRPASHASPPRHIAPLEPIQDKRLHRIGLALTCLLMVGYSVIMLRYLFLLQASLNTHAEDMGIMDQVLWNTAHGHFWQQTICNTVSDRNCLGDVSRWAIHFEPLMLALVPLYWFVPGPQTLQTVQVVGVALGALPAYWLASRRLRSPWWGVIAAGAYLLLPTLRAAVTSDFHMVTLAAPLLMFALYYLYDRNDRGLIITCLLAMATKEQVPLDVFMIGAAVAYYQRRTAFGVKIMLMAAIWAVVALNIIHFMSPLGHSPTAERYDGVFGTLERLPTLVTDTTRLGYIWGLISNTGGLGLLAPWALLLAAPAALLNALSSDANQYTGLYQYNADIAPFLWLAGVEGFVILLAALVRLREWVRQAQVQSRLIPAFRLLTMCLVAIIAGNIAFHSPASRALNPNIVDPVTQVDPHLTVTDHTKLAQVFFDLIPTYASVAAQSDLVPHLSHRNAIYQFPTAEPVDYILLDMEGNYYPEPNEGSYKDAVEDVLDNGFYALLATQDGYILLGHTDGYAGPVRLPLSFCPTSPVTNQLLLQNMQEVGPCGPLVASNGSMPHPAHPVCVIRQTSSGRRICVPPRGTLKPR